MDEKEKVIDVIKKDPLAFVEAMNPDVFLQEYQKQIIRAFAVPQEMIEGRPCIAPKRISDETFRSLYLGEYVAFKPIALAVGSYVMAKSIAIEKGIRNPRDLKYIQDIGHLRSIQRNWKNHPDAPMVLAIHHKLWDEAKVRGIVED